MADIIYDVVKVYEHKAGTKMVSIPSELAKKLNVNKGDSFRVRSDEQGRIIYEPNK